jgi:LuxR family maltose regulon positive regulatory protein
VNFIERLLVALENEPWAEDLILVTESGALIGPISEREQQVLRLLHSDLSTPEIAEELIVAVSTVRSHIKNIYRKLNVHSRLEALDRAKELNLL